MSIEQNRMDNPYFGNKSNSPMTKFEMKKEPVEMNPISPMTYNIMSSFKPIDFNPLFKQTIPSRYSLYEPSESCKDNPMCNYTMPSFSIEQNRMDNPYFGKK